MNQETLNAKKVIVDSLAKSITDNAATIVVEYRGLTVSDLHGLKKSLRENGAELGVYKNSLVARAAEKAGKNELSEILTGPNAVIFAKDVFASPKILTKFAKKNEHLVLKGGLIEGQYVGVDTLKQLATIPGRDGLISMFLSCLQAPIRSFACAVKAVAEK
ncbi:MAG: 50S ribosomal protein L10 [Erysipelotrichaceae bacterium]|jgi:large subunit ribosomal protein L10|nr:50S ribosomal protein L10 [Erysipelotrichaceae bacterium]